MPHACCGSGSATANGAWQMAHCEHRIVRARTIHPSRSRLRLVNVTAVPGGTSLLLRLKRERLFRKEEPFSFVGLEAAAQTADYVVELLERLVGDLHLPCAGLVVNRHVETQSVGERLLQSACVGALGFGR